MNRLAQVTAGTVPPFALKRDPPGVGASLWQLFLSTGFGFIVLVIIATIIILLVVGMNKKTRKLSKGTMKIIDKKALQKDFSSSITNARVIDKYMCKNTKISIIAKVVSFMGAICIGFISGGYLFVYKLGVVSRVHGFPEGNIIQSQMNWFYISVGLAAVVIVCLYVVSIQLFRHKGLLALYSFYISIFLFWFVLRDFVIVINKNTPNMFLGHDISWVLQFFYRPTHVEYIIDDRRFENVMFPLLW